MDVMDVMGMMQGIVFRDDVSPLTALWRSWVLGFYGALGAKGGRMGLRHQPSVHDTPEMIFYLHTVPRATTIMVIGVP